MELFLFHEAPEVLSSGSPGVSECDGQVPRGLCCARGYCLCVWKKRRALLLQASSSVRVFPLLCFELSQIVAQGWLLPELLMFLYFAVRAVRRNSSFMKKTTDSSFFWNGYFFSDHTDVESVSHQWQLSMHCPCFPSLILQSQGQRTLLYVHPTHYSTHSCAAYIPLGVPGNT